MIISNTPQGTPEWLKERAGIPTASSFDKIVTTKGEPSKSRQKYMYQLAAERITGVREETYQNGAMVRGIEMESEARAMYEVVTGNSVEQAGLCYLDEQRLFGCSPDGLVGEDGAIEIKCPSSAVHVSYLLEGALPTDYFQQTQGQLFVTGREWVDFVSYYPGLKALIVKVRPDKKFIEALKAELKAFCQELNEVTEKLRRI